MKTIITSMGRPLRCALCTALIVIAALWALPGSARAQLYASQGSVGGTVGEYDAVTGAAINASFITGLSFPNGLAVAGNTLFMTIYGYPGYGGPHGTGTLTGLVGEYDATTGAPINANLVTGLSFPHDLAVSGNTLFVTDGIGTVGAYNATTGAPINANLVTG
jgi:hypothetical protein